MNGGLRGVGDQSVLNERDNLGSNASPAGGLAVSANDMARWLMIQLDGGVLPGEWRQAVQPGGARSNVEAGRPAAGWAALRA